MIRCFLLGQEPKQVLSDHKPDPYRKLRRKPTWTERVAAIHPRAVLTERTRAKACRRVGTDTHAVAAIARDLGVGWATIMRAVYDHGTALVEDPARRRGGRAGAGGDQLPQGHPPGSRWVTSLVDLERRSG
jgi:Helix-turn-helix domain of transposase family ISL3